MCASFSSAVLVSRIQDAARVEGRGVKRRRSDNGAEASTSEGLLLRHAGVLGLAAIIGATRGAGFPDTLTGSHPFDVPPWMPAMLVSFAEHINDPPMIKATIRKTFSEFWVTHQDAWPLHKEKFDEEQLATLTNLLVSPTYFL